MKSNIHIMSSCLKDVLSLFDRNVELKKIILGDTWHPSSGFVDEKVLGGKNRVSELLDFNYNFKGLVEFEAFLNSIKIELINNNENGKDFVIRGNAREIERLKNKIIEENAHHPNKYKFTYNVKYDKKNKYD